MDFGFGGGGGGNTFNATSPSGPVASGSYSMGEQRGGGMGGGADLSGYRNDIMDGGVLSQLASADTNARDRLDRQQDLYRQDYSNMFGQGLLGMLTMGREGSGAMRTGMQDFYGNVSQNRPNFGQYLDRAGQGFSQSSGDIRGVGDRMSRDYGSGLGALTGLASQLGSAATAANSPDFVNDFMRRYAPTDLEKYFDSRALRQARAADQQSAVMRSPYYGDYQRGLPAIRAAERRIPLARPGMMVGGRRAI